MLYLPTRLMNPGLEVKKVVFDPVFALNIVFSERSF